MQMGTITLRAVPGSAPDPIGWPTVDQSSLTADWDRQPTLPWNFGCETDDPAASGPSSDRDQIRLLCFGESWAAPLPDGLADPAAFSMRMAQALVEAMQRLRPPGQLARWLDGPTMTQLTALTRRNRWSTRPLLIALHLHRGSPRTVEVVAVLRDAAGRGSAMAFRLDAVGRRWTCTALQTVASQTLSAVQQ
jgi:hypothetical protein